MSNDWSGFIGFLLFIILVLLLLPDRLAVPRHWEAAIEKCEPHGKVRSYQAHSMLTGVGDLTCNDGSVFSEWLTPSEVSDE